MPTFDAVLSRSAREFIASLDLADRFSFELALDNLLKDPNPDGVSKVTLDFFPHSPGVVGASVGEFWVTYSFLNAFTIQIASIYWSPDSPRRSGELYET